MCGPQPSPHAGSAPYPEAMVPWLHDPRFEPSPTEMLGLLDLVLGDLQGARPIAVQVGWDPASMRGG